MRKVLLLSFLFISMFSFAQKKEAIPIIRFHGQVKDWENRHRIYYSMNGEPFSPKKSFITDTNFKYQFDLSKTPYKDVTTGNISFGFDSTTKPNDQYACVHKLDIGQAISLAKQLNKKLLDLQTDLPINFNCELTVMYGAEGEAEKFPGTYLLTQKDTSWTIELKSDLLRYTATKTPGDKDYTNEEWGSWNYEAQKGILKFYVNYRMDKQLGVMIDKFEERDFEVFVYEKGYTFKSKDGSTLVKLR